MQLSYLKIHQLFKSIALIQLYLCFIASSAIAMPGTVILIRHAEKTKDKENIHLSEKGYARAAALPAFFEKFDKGSELKLFAQGQKHTKSSLRPIETLIPTSQKFKIEINHKFVKDESNKLVDFLKTSRVLKNKTVVVSWGHDEIGKISQMLGQDNGEWPSKVFDRAWILKFNVQGKLLNFSNVPQNVLPEDTQE
jgi:hypothetical protein